MYSTMPADWVCCAYLRKSREDEERERRGKEETLARHESMINALAKDNGHEIKRYYREVVSGETIKGRPEMMQLLRDVASGKWDAVYVVEASRLGRGGGSDQEKIVNAFRYTGTWLVTEYKTYAPGSVPDMDMLKRELRSSEDELASISIRLKRGKYKSAEEGYWQSTGRTPYGWKAVRVKGRWELEPDENHHNLLRMYDMLEEGKGTAEIASVFNREQIPRPRGGYHWTSASVRSIVMNPVHCGYMRWAANLRKRVFDPETFEVKKVVVKSNDPMVIKGRHYGKGGIPRDRWERLTSRLSTSAKLHKGKQLVNPLAGILKCGKCGYTMSFHMMSSGSSKAYFYSHKVPKAMTRHCDGVRAARADLVMEMLVNALQETVKDISLSMTRDDAGKAYQEQMRSLSTALDKARESKERVLAAYEAGAYGIDELKTRKDDIEGKIGALEKEIDCLRPPAYTEDTVSSLHECIKMLEDDSVSAEEKNQFLKRVIDRVDYWNDTPKRVLPNIIRLDVYLK